MSCDWCRRKVSMEYSSFRTAKWQEDEGRLCSSGCLITSSGYCEVSGASGTVSEASTVVYGTIDVVNGRLCLHYG